MLFGIVEPEEDPRVVRALPCQGLVAVVTVLQEQSAVIELGEQRRRLPSVLEALLHGADIGLPFVFVDRDEDVVVGTGERHQELERQPQRPQPPVLTLREPGGERGVAAPAAGQEFAHPERQLVVGSGLERRGHAEPVDGRHASWFPSPVWHAKPSVRSVKRSTRG